MREEFNYCNVAQQTDVGCKRSANEDWLASFESPNGLVAVVCDGMGGHVGGQVASHVAVDAIQQYMMQERPNTTPFEQIIEAINAANAAILNRTIIQPELAGMGSTCVMLIVREGRVYIGSVGDSRIYLIRNHTIRQLTVDQSYVQMLVDAGQITKEQAEHHPRKNEITNALGLHNMKPAKVLSNPILPEAGDCFLLCSDGLSGMVSDTEICKIVSRQGELSQQDRVAQLIARAKHNGGVDNITCQIVEFSITPNAAVETPKLRKKLPFFVGCVLLLIAICCGIFFYLKSDNIGGATINNNAQEYVSEKTGRTVPIEADITKGDVFLTLTEIAGNELKIVYNKNKEEKTQCESIESRLKEVKVVNNPKIFVSLIEEKPKTYQFTSNAKLKNDEQIVLQIICDSNDLNIKIFPTKELNVDNLLDGNNFVIGNGVKGSSKENPSKEDGNVVDEKVMTDSIIDSENGEVKSLKQENDTMINVKKDSCRILITAKKYDAKKDTIIWTIDVGEQFCDCKEINGGWYKMKCINHDCLIDIPKLKDIPDSVAVITQRTKKEKQIILRISK